jgi:hypothetical protein
MMEGIGTLRSILILLNYWSPFRSSGAHLLIVPSAFSEEKMNLLNRLEAAIEC